MKNTRNQPVNIPVSKLRPFEGHPFKVKDDEEMNTLIESVQTVGILSPLIVRPIENTNEYEVISGHRRLHAAVKAGITEVPALIYALDRDSAAIAVVDSNLHREHILPSEKAFAYKLKMEALSHQGTSRQLGEKWSVSQISESSNESERQIHRYIRLTYLIPEFLDKMDNGEIALSVGVELSFLDEESQYDVLEQCEINDCTPSYSQAWRMHKADREGLLIDVKAYCDKAQELYEKFCDCYTTEQVTAVIDDQLSRMQANKISVKGNLFFIPNQYLPLLNILEDYIESLAKYNLNDDCTIVCNSMHVVDSERQREKMAEEFYNNYKRDIEMYQKSIQKFIDSGGTSPTVIERWIKKINALNQKKSTYEDILRQRLDNLDKDYALLKMQAQELIVRNNKSQISMPLAA